MQFQPKTEKELQEALVWPKGEYDFEVKSAEKAVSGDKSKNPGMEYIKLNVQIWNADGETRFVNGILHPKMEVQLRHFCYATGLGAMYENGTLGPHHCDGRTGKLKLKVKEAEGPYPAKNEIQDFIVPEEKPKAAAAPSQNAPDPDDSVPF